ncbi:WecB/TagA/CpsF family glycosyltransferase [Spirosoma fluminis]
MENAYRTRKLFNKVNYAIVDYNLASNVIIENALNHLSFGVSALAVHGLMEAFNRPDLEKALSKIQLIVPDGQPIRWALNAFFGVGLKDRVYGPKLVLDVLQKGQEHKLKVYLYGSHIHTLIKLKRFIELQYPSIIVCGLHEDRFREATELEDLEDIKKINDSGANIVLVGRGCPRQETWVSNHVGKINAVMMAVGAAFDFHAGNVKQAPAWMQRNGLEWLYRLGKEPQRLWKRYLFTNTHFIYLFLITKLKLTNNQY